MIGEIEGFEEHAARRSHPRNDPAQSQPGEQPEPWKELAPWRETTLFHVTAPSSRRLFEAMGKTMAEAVSEEFSADDLSESCLRAELRAVAKDCRYLQGFLTRLGQGAEASDLDADDRSLASEARHFARELARLSTRIESRIGPAPRS